MDDMDTSKYYVVQITEYQEMKAEIERLQHELSGVWAVANLLAARLETISSGNEMVLHSYSKAQEEARRG